LAGTAVATRLVHKAATARKRNFFINVIILVLVIFVVLFV